MSEFCLEFNMDNAAFDGDASIEVCRIFNSVKNQIANGCGDGIVNDVNGNTIGRWYAEIDDKAQIPLPRKSTYDELDNENPCVVCGKNIKKTRFMVHIVEGGGILQKIGVPYEDEASDLGRPLTLGCTLSAQLA